MSHGPTPPDMAELGRKMQSLEALMAEGKLVETADVLDELAELMTNMAAMLRLADSMGFKPDTRTPQQRRHPRG